MNLYDIKNESLVAEGKLRVEWAARNMPVLKSLRGRFEKEKPLQGIRLAACLHVTTETANLMETLKAGGAEVRLCASNPLSTQDDVAAYLAIEARIPTYAIKGEDNETYYRHLKNVLEFIPTITMDDGADLVSTIHKESRQVLSTILGGTEETTTGVIRLRAMEKDEELMYPVIAVNDAQTKHLFDNRYGTGQSTVDGILRATNILISGSVIVVCGYGWCGKGVSGKCKGMGANVIVCEVDPIRALEAKMDGFAVMPLIEAIKNADVIITVTGNTTVIDEHHLENAKDGIILANSGHFNVEINVGALERLALSKRTARTNVEEFVLKNGKKIFLLGEGRLINLAAAEGHPASVMDMSFANQALSAVYIAHHAGELDNKVYSVPKDIDETIARLKLEALGVTIDILSEQQKRYLSSWKEGT